MPPSAGKKCFAVNSQATIVTLFPHTGSPRWSTNSCTTSRSGSPTTGLNVHMRMACVSELHHPTQSYLLLSGLTESHAS
jgi:hypothetical protein